MVLKYFTTFENTSVAINPSRVMFVEEVSNGAIVHFNVEQRQLLKGSYLEIVSQLNAD
jgi:hypothetical protein